MSARQEGKPQRRFTKAEQRQMRREQRRLAEASLARQRRLRTVALLGALPLLVVAIIVGVVVGGVGRVNKPVVTSSSDLTGPGEHFRSQGHCHIGYSCPRSSLTYYATQFHYNSDPPTSGPHLEKFPPVFINDHPLKRYMLPHMLEHGNVEILYNPNDSLALIDKLRAYAQAFDAPFLSLQTPQAAGVDVGEQLEQAQAIFLIPYPGLRSPFVMTAWTRLDTFHEYDKGEMDRFANAWIGNAQNASQ